MRRFVSYLSPNHKSVIGQTAVQVAGKAVTVLGSFLVVRMLTSQGGLGLNGFGDFVLVTSFVAYFYLLLDFGFNTIFVQKAIDEPEKQHELFSELFSLRIGLSVFLMIVGLCILAFLPHPYSTPIKLGIIVTLPTIALQSLFMTGNAIFQAKLAYQYSVAVASVASILNLAATYLALQLGAGLPGVLGAYILEFALLGIGAVLVVRRWLPWRFRIDWTAWRRSVADAWPLGISILLTLFYFRSDIFLLSILPLDANLMMSNRQAVSLYSVPYSMFEVFLTLPAFMMNAAYPLLLKARQESLSSLRHFMWQMLAGSAALSLMAAIAIWVAAPVAISLQTAGNADFGPSIDVLRILGLSLPAFFLTNVLVFTLISLGSKRLLPAVYLLAGIINVAANVWLIPKMGTVAAALTTGLTEAIILVFLAALVWSVMGAAMRENEASVS
jgi:PST family polysaccharide transporter